MRWWQSKVEENEHTGTLLPIQCSTQLCAVVNTYLWVFIRTRGRLYWPPKFQIVLVSFTQTTMTNWLLYKGLRTKLICSAVITDAVVSWRHKKNLSRSAVKPMSHSVPSECRQGTAGRAPATARLKEPSCSWVIFSGPFEEELYRDLQIIIHAGLPVWRAPWWSSTTGLSFCGSCRQASSGTAQP